MEDVLKIKKELEKTIPENDSRRALELLRSLESIPMSLDVLHKTHIGMTVNKIRKSVDNSEVSSLSKVMVKKWKKLLSSEKPTGVAPTPASTAPSVNTASNINNQSHNQHQQQSQQVVGGDSNARHQAPAAAANNNNNNNNSSSNNNHHHQHHNHNQSQHHNQQPTPAPAEQASTKNVSSSSAASAAASSTTNNPHKAAPMQTEVPATTSEVRLKCRQLLTDALKKPLPGELSQEAFLEEDILAGRIEESIYQEFKATDMKYKNRVRSRVSNLGDSKNPYLRLNVLRGDLAPEKIAKMSAEDMASDELKKERERFTKEAINDHQMTFTSGTKTSEIKCPACKKYDVTYNQVQTRSADEPMTTFCYCNLCGKRWKFC